MNEKQESSKESVLKLLHHTDIKPNTLQIIEIMGGIQNVLTFFLDNRNSEYLSTSQLSQLHQLISTPSKYEEKNKNILLSNIETNRQLQIKEDVIKEDIYRNSYTFDVNNTLLHSVFSPLNANKIRNFIYHKIVASVLSFIGFIAFVLGMILRVNSEITNIYIITAYCLVLIPWMILLHLSFNKQAYKLCIKGFEYWIKTGYVIILCVAMLFLDSSSDNELDNIRNVVLLIFLVLLISMIALFDAMQTSKKWKIFISAFVALMCLFNTIWWLLFAPQDNDYKILISMTESVISMQSLVASCWRILSIFFCKQLFNVWRKNGRAVAISYSPRLIWINGNTKKKVIKEIEKKDNNLEEEEKQEIKIEAVMMRKQRKESFSIQKMLC
eukprot:308557_1